MLAFWNNSPIIRAGAISIALSAGSAVAAAQDAANPPPVQLTPAVPAETAPAPVPAPAAPAQTALPTPKETFSAIGRFIDQSISNVGAGVKGAGESIGSATSAAGDLAKGVGDAAGTVVRMPTNVVSGMERCQMTASGTADCTAAGAALCRQKGFSDGKSVDITSAQKCPVQVLLQGRSGGPECKTESFVARAVCQ